VYLVKTPNIVQSFYPSLNWRVRTSDNSIYLTFDDGPDEKTTPVVLQLLAKYKANATFFCVGEKVKKNKDLFNQLLKNGHTVGNHTYNHLNGKKTKLSDYLDNVKKADDLIGSKLFRPPYGRITSSQIKSLKDTYKIIMWTVLPGDFDNKVGADKVLSRSLRYSEKGSIIVFHDNKKFHDKMLFALEAYLEYFTNKGFTFNNLSDKISFE